MLAKVGLGLCLIAFFGVALVEMSAAGCHRSLNW